MKTAILTSLLIATCASASAATVTESYHSGTLDQAIPDHSPVLTSFLIRIGSSDIVSLSRVRLTLELHGAPGAPGYAGDIFASLIQSPFAGPLSIDDPAAVLLNRVPFGYDGWDLTFEDAGPGGDVHLADEDTGILAGTFEPDGRLASDDSLRPALLGAFVGGAGNGDWRLNLGDLAEFGTMRLVDWHLELTGETAAPVVPEPSSLLAGGIVLASTSATWFLGRRRRRNRSTRAGLVA